jgi:autotransporter-associated beta strand protein
LNNHYLQLNGLTGYSANAFNTTSNNFAALSAEYRNVLIGGAYDTGGNVATITLKNLVVGRNYTVQFWINDPRIGDSATRYAFLNGTATEIHYNDTDFAGGVGAYVTGTFTADATMQSFTLDGAATLGAASTQLNAIQLRVEPLPLLAALYWDVNSDTAGFGTAGGTWGSDANWTTNALGSTLPDQPAVTTVSNVVHLGTATAGLASGAINVVSTQSFDTLSFGLASGPISITNGYLGLTAPSSTIRLNSITNTFGSSLIPGGSLTVRALAPQICDGFPTTTDNILFRNAKLSDYTGAEAKMGGSYITGGSVPLTASVYYWGNDGNSATCQVQIADGFIKCVKLELRQSGNDIVGKALWAKYTTGSLGYNFDAGGTGGTVATWFTANGYGVTEFKLLPYDSQFIQHRFREFLNGSYQTIASNAMLSAFKTADCFMAGGSINNDVPPAYTYYFANSGTNATFQAQTYDYTSPSDQYTKCVKVELVQAGPHIQARLLYAKYNAGNTLGYNFDLGGSGGTVAPSFTAVGYGVRSIRLNVSQPTLALSGRSAFDSLTTILGSTLTLTGLLGNGTFSSDIVNNGSLALAPSNIQRITGPISGSGAVVMNGTGSTIVYNAATLTTTPVVIATNKPLAHYVAAGGVFGAGSMDYPPVALAPYYFANDGTTATVQLQVFNGAHTKVAKVEFKQVGADITAKIVYTKHCSPDGNNVGADYDYTGTLYTYNLIQVMLYPNKVFLSGSNTYLGGTFVNGGELEATTTSSIPSFGGIVVNGGNLILSASGFADPATGALGGMNNPLTIFTGGTLTLANQFNAGHSRPITLDGGTLNSTHNNASDSINYVCNLTMKNGARITGNALRTGYTSQPTFRIQGTSPSFIEAGLLMVSGLWSLEVDNVTGDDTTDLTISGNLNNFSGFGPQSTYKRNAGTVSLSGNNSGYTGPVQIEAGILRLDSIAALTSANLIYLMGGTLMSTTFSNSVGNVSLSTGAITLGTDKLIAGTATLANNTTVNLNTGSLAFADSSAATWTAGKTLNLVGTLGRRSLRFGTTSAGLTATQLQMITLNGATTRFILDENGYLVELRGTVIQFM